VGELRCVIGPNGAGKTTMMDVVTGKTRPDAGSAFFGQTIDLTRLTEAEIAHAGIGRKFQKPTVFEQHSVFENLELAMKADKRVGPTLRARLDGAARDRIASTMETIKLLPEARRPAGMLSHGQKQWLEYEVSAMLRVAGVNQYYGIAILLVEQYYDFAKSLADHYVVLSRGEVVARGAGATMDQDNVRAHLAV
jgi:ABC-type uncharacterized transport system ATPase subunit